MNRNVSRQITPERGVDIRMPSTALLGVSSADRYENNTQRVLNSTSPFSVLLTSGQNFLNGFFTRIALTEVRIPWYLPTLSNRNNYIVLNYFPAGPPGPPQVFTLGLTPGWYSPTTLAAELQRVIRQVPAAPNGNNGANKPNFTITYNATQYRFEAASNVAGDEFIFLTFPTSDGRTGVYEMMNWRNNFVDVVQLSGPPTMLSTEFIDIVCNQLTYAQDVKDGDTGKMSHDVVARVYLAAENTLTDPTTLGSAPFVVYRQFATPKQIKWDSNLPVGQLQFDLYDDKGVPLGTRGMTATIAGGIITPQPSPDNDNSLGDWSITLLVSEV